MKKVGFVGTYDKIDMILYAAKILTLLEKKVLIVDATINQKAKYIVPSITPTMSYVTTFEDIDVAVGFKSFEQIKQYLYISENESLPYDIVLIDTDSNEAIETFNFYENEKNFFVTSFDCYSLKRGLATLSTLRTPIELTKILFSMNIFKEDDDYLNFLSLEYKIRWNDYRIYFPIENGDASVISENQRAEKIMFKKLSSSYKEGLAYVTQEIEKNISDSQIRRIIKNIEKGV